VANTIVQIKGGIPKLSVFFGFWGLGLNVLLQFYQQGFYEKFGHLTGT
jgi:hypothetical protein